MEGMAILGILLIIMLFGDKITPTIRDSSSGFIKSTSQAGEYSRVTSNPSYSKSISLSTGNARYTYQSYEEYITIYNRGREPISITGWKLENNKEGRAYNVGGSDLRRFPSDTVVIGQGALFISPTGNSQLQNIVLQSGEDAVIMTGSVGNQLPYKIVSFKENICSGYLENLPEYTFTPQLSTSCPRPSDEFGVEQLDTECRKFVERMPSCHTPKFNTRDENGDICTNCVDEKPLSTACIAFIKSRFNYGSCIANHRYDPNFSSNTWRVFLNHGWELWAEEFETIKLFDQFGRLVTSSTY